MSLMPEKFLSVSPQLAATIGLEEALLYQLLGDIKLLSGGRNPGKLSLDCQHLLTLTPFWDRSDLGRVFSSLEDKGIITVLSGPFGADPTFVLLFSDGAAAAEPRTPSTAERTASAAPRATVKAKVTRLMDTTWQPAKDVTAQLNQYGIPASFIEEQIPEFVTYWAERGDPMHSWNAKFLKHALRQWREDQTATAKRSRETAITGDWQPSQDAFELLNRQGGINRNFIEDAIPEFILYWRERGDRRSTWNTDFVRHVRTQWAKFTATLEQDSEPRIIARDWRPSEDLFEVLHLANIPREFALLQVPEFTLYWRESGQAISSWNTKFLQHVKRQWARHCATGDKSNERPQDYAPAVSTRDRSLVEDLTDRSWAG